MFSGPCWAIQGPRSVLPAGQLRRFRGHWVNKQVSEYKFVQFDPETCVPICGGYCDIANSSVKLAVKGEAEFGYNGLYLKTSLCAGSPCLQFDR